MRLMAFIFCALTIVPALAQESDYERGFAKGFEAGLAQGQQLCSRHKFHQCTLYSIFGTAYKGHWYPSEQESKDDAFKQCQEQTGSNNAVCFTHNFRCVSQ